MVKLMLCKAVAVVGLEMVAMVAIHRGRRSS